jgi:(2R)-3-sulfolactate dehydrogenase (NADP+)
LAHTLLLRQIQDLACRALIAANTERRNAEIVAASIAAAEADGIGSHGLLRLPTYCAHARSGKVDGFARPVLSHAAAAALQVDACNGFAHPAIALALDALVPLATQHGIAAVSIRNSYNSGVMGHHVEWLARRGLVALGFANAPAVIAPWGGRAPVFGTNPIAFAAPSSGGDPIVVDQAASTVARGEVMLRAQRGETIPDGWGLDAAGQATTDPHAVLNGGSMLPAGGYKGVTLALVVEVLAAALTASLPSAEAGSLTQDDGKPAGVGQLFIALQPAAFGAGEFGERVSDLCRSITAQPGARLPGSRRFAMRESARTQGVMVDEALLQSIASLVPGSR